MERKFCPTPTVPIKTAKGKKIFDNYCITLYSLAITISGLDTWSNKFTKWEKNFAAEHQLNFGKATKIGINGFGRIGRLVLR